ncbi:MAG: hypothetical protein ACK4VK_01230 [Aquificaceae bacterium]
MRSWVYYVELLGHYEDGSFEKKSAVYVVAFPLEGLSPVDMECYAMEYAPANLAINHGKAYAVGVDEDIKNPESYSLAGYREDLELYVFNEGLSFEEGLEEVFKILLDNFNKERLKGFVPLVDVGSPPEEIMVKCLKKVLSA